MTLHRREAVHQFLGATIKILVRAMAGCVLTLAKIHTPVREHGGGLIGTPIIQNVLWIKGLVNGGHNVTKGRQACYSEVPFPSREHR